MEEEIAGLADSPGSGRPRKVPQTTPDDFMEQIKDLTTSHQTMQKISQELGCQYARGYTRSILHEYIYSIKALQKIHANAALPAEVR